MKNTNKKSDFDIMTIIMFAFVGIVIPILFCVMEYEKEKAGVQFQASKLINYMDKSTTFFISMLTVLVCITIKIKISHFTHKYLILATIVGLIISVSASTLDEPLISNGVLSVETLETITKYLLCTMWGWCLGLQASISFILLYIIQDWRKDNELTI